MLPPARWYFDADTIGPGKVLSHVRTDVTWPGDDGQRGGPARRWLPACPVTSTDTDDRDWIETVTQSGMSIITRDKHIQTRLLETEAVRRAGARMFALTSTGELSKWELLEVVVSRWRDLERAVQQTPPPFIFSVTRASTLSRVL